MKLESYVYVYIIFLPSERGYYKKTRATKYPNEATIYAKPIYAKKRLENLEWIWKNLGKGFDPSGAEIHRFKIAFDGKEQI
jgi:hypothetical protein